ncbi:chorismate lyase [Pseudoalteromonas sp. LC2018020214]|uniref:chorismate--pyruvate lyase family protein n=1 Tax=Pseudoalteromonas sp. LC2018020214 TaxID=2799564 RepID=UPI0019086954|nr:chorismate lyase [Pseudoalteromonas sp. LC2018020214]QQM63569.1 chorismate lyase [Pseudoalteromonas sp. LC2018020214]
MTTYPLSISANWQSTSYISDLSPLEQEWLFEQNSLTAKLKSNSKTFNVKVLSEQLFTLSPEQNLLLNSTAKTAINREVLLLCDNKPVVYAQSWLPKNDSINPLHNMGERPLGDVIFQDPALKRTDIEIAYFDDTHPIQQLVTKLNLPEKNLLGRRSVFSLKEYKFLVCEVFLPGAYLYS